MSNPLTLDEAYAFLDSRPGWLVLTTIGRGGYPHSVPIGYFRMGQDIYVGGRASAQRLRNVERNPRVSALLETGNTRRDIKGLLIQGDAKVITDSEELLPIAREAARQRGAAEAELPAQAPPGIAYLRISPKRIISWDYSRDA